MSNEVRSLADWRHRRLLTQVELHAMCRRAVRRSTISAIESGAVTRPHPRTMRIISRALGLEPVQIREFSDAMARERG